MQEHERGAFALVLDVEINAVCANDAHLKHRPYCTSAQRLG